MGEANRQCGSCTLCCRLTAVPELEKKVYVWCENCAVGKGCLIYDRRPASCQAFECLWLKRGLDESLRPDRCKVMFEQLTGGKSTILALMDPGRPKAFIAPRVQTLITQLVQEGHPIVTASGPTGQKNVILAKGKTMQDVWDELGINPQPETIEVIGGRK